MNRSLPPLNALRAFEAAARTLSFTKAAEELFITQGAVSKQIKILEEYFDLPLFIRRHRQLVLTEAGSELLPKLTQMFDELMAVSQKIKLANRPELRIKVAPSFAMRWLFPRLSRFKAMFPELPLQITSAWQDEPSDEELELNLYDLVIHCGEPPIQSRYANFLRDEVMVPVCSPKLDGVEALIDQPAKLKAFTLLHPTLLHQDWTMWCKSVGHEVLGMTERDIHKGLEFDTLDMAITAAVAGHGITLADYILVKDEIEAGHLITPFDLPVQSSFVYSVLVMPDKLERLEINSFVQWLFDEVKACD